MTDNMHSEEKKRKVDLLKCLHVNMETDELSNLLVIKACGISMNENAGIPLLVPTKNSHYQLSDGILEFNFIIQPADVGPEKKLEWDISVVYRMDFLPQGIKAIKVNAANNADIAFLMN